MKKVIMPLLLIGCCGCLGNMIAGNIVKPINPVPKKEQLAYHTTNFSTAVNAVGSLESNDQLAKEKVKSIQKMYGWATDAGEINTALAVAHDMGVQGARQQIARRVDEGIEWSANLISQIGGGSVAGGGIIATIIALLRRNSKKAKVINVVNAELGEEEKKKIKKALEHTGAEGVVV